MTEENIQQEGQQQGTVEQPQVEPETLRGRALFEKNIRAKYGNDIDEDEMYDKIMSDYDGQREQVKNAQRDREQFAKAMENPETANLIEELATYAPDSEMAKAIAMGKQRKEEALQRQERLFKNLDESQKVVEQFIKENNIPEDEAKELLGQFMETFGKPLSEGSITSDMLNVAAKGFLYDQHKTKWEEAGRVAGRNDKIEENRKRFEGDGTVKTNPSSSPMREGNADNERVREAAYFKEIADRQRQHPFMH